MNTFLYAIPGGNPPTAELRKAAGLADVFDGEVTYRDYKGQFFEGEPAVIFVPEPFPADLARCVPETQTWQKSASGKYWVGYDNDAIPGEIDLRRARQLEGHEVKLGNGEKWLIPIARNFKRGSVLPKSLILGKGGELMTEELAEYAEFSAQVEKYWEWFFAEITGKENTEISLKEMWQIIVRAMQFNYRITEEGISLLRLVRIDNSAASIFHEILGAVIDLPAVRKLAEESKKKEDTKAQDT